jgi:thiamine biosynthesis protein ThiS
VKIILNGKDEILLEPLDIENFLKVKGIDRLGIVVELNREIIKNEEWSTTILRENDTLEILRFIGGGTA